MRLLILSAAAFALCACNPTTTETSTATETAVSTQLANACAASADADWVRGATTLHVNAATTGTDCANAGATLVVKDATGATLYSEDYPTTHVMTLASAQDVAGMQTALSEWIRDSHDVGETSSGLPRWPAGAAQPPNGEFPFYPDEGVTRERYNQVRSANLPMFCFVQGMESEACLVLENGRLVKVGAQSFPG